MSDSLRHRNVLNLLGMARIAKVLTSGEEGCLNAIRSQKAWLVLISKDASAPTRKKFHDKCQFYEVEVLDTDFTMEELGKAIGMSPRSSLAILDQGLAEKFKLRLRQTTGENNSGSY